MEPNSFLICYLVENFLYPEGPQGGTVRSPINSWLKLFTIECNFTFVPHSFLQSTLLSGTQKLKSLTMIWFEWKKVLLSFQPKMNCRGTLPIPPLVVAHRPSPWQSEDSGKFSKKATINRNKLSRIKLTCNLFLFLGCDSHLANVTVNRAKAI